MHAVALVAEQKRRWGVPVPTQLFSPKQPAALDTFPNAISIEDRDLFSCSQTWISNS
ncbi:MAG: hypothetical protein ACI8XD_001984 [Thermoproteota archaeon]|jgi:hypothetical protein